VPKERGHYIVMELLYKEAMPFEYKMYKKPVDIPLSDGVKSEFNSFYKKIQEGGKFEDFKEELKNEYEIVSRHVVNEIRKSGNKKSNHVLEEIEFIFACSWRMIQQYNVSQNDLAYVWGIDQNKFSKLDIYPQRSYEAFAKEENKALSPFQTDSEGIQIARFINKKVQAVHTCYGFIGITNDLDIFANISSTDKKAFVLTAPLEFEPDAINDIQRANYALARYLFAQGNRLFDDDGKYVPAGCIKDKIISLLNMQDISIVEQEELVREILISDEDLSEFLVDGDYGDFEEQREKYRSSIEVVQIKDDMCKSGIVPYGIEYEDSRFGAIENNEDVILDKIIRRDIKEKSTQEIVFEVAETAQRQIDMFESQIIGCLNIRKMFARRGEDILKRWIDYIRCSVKEKSIILNPSYEARVKTAAGFWISETFKGQRINGDSIGRILNYLNAKSLLTYIDSLNAPPAGKIKDMKKEEKSHICVISEKGDIIGDLRKTTTINLTAKVERPLMIYIDAEAYNLEKKNMEQLQEIGKVIIIIHSKNKDFREMGIQLIDAGLNLYMLNTMEEK